MPTSISKITTFFLFALFISSAFSCSRQSYNPIPDVCVNFEIRLVSDPLFYDLSAAGNSVIVTSSTNNWGVCAAGFGNNGIIVYNSGDDFYAFDCTCPYCYETGGLIKAVKIDGVYAVCPQCGTNYALPSSGTPTSEGPGRYPLKNYRTSVDGYSIHVWNNY